MYGVRSTVIGLMLVVLHLGENESSHEALHSTYTVLKADVSGLAFGLAADSADWVLGNNVG